MVKQISCKLTLTQRHTLLGHELFQHGSTSLNCHIWQGVIMRNVYSEEEKATKPCEFESIFCSWDNGYMTYGMERLTGATEEKPVEFKACFRRGSGSITQAIRILEMLKSVGVEEVNAESAATYDSAADKRDVLGERIDGLAQSNVSILIDHLRKAERLCERYFKLQKEMGEVLGTDRYLVRRLISESDY